MAVIWRELGRNRRFRLPENQLAGTLFPGALFEEADIGARELVLHDLADAELRWWPRGAAVYDADGRLVAELGGQSSPPPGELGDQPLHLLDATVASLVQWPARRNFCHLVCEGFPVIEGLHSAGVLGEVDALIVDDYRAGFVREVLGLYGAGNELIEVGDMGRLRCKRLLMFEPLLHVAHWLHDAAERVFRRIFDSLGPLPAPELDLVISRPRGWRALANADEVVARLPGFQLVRLENVETLREQALLFARARTIIAPHGAGLTNIAFCQPGARVMEVFNQGYGTSTFYGLSQISGVRYFALMDVRGKQAYEEARKFEDMLVDVDEVAQLVDPLAAPSGRRSPVPARRARNPFWLLR